MRLERFGEKVNTFLQQQILAGSFRAVTAGVDDFQFRILQQKLLGQFFSGQAANARVLRCLRFCRSNSRPMTCRL